MYEIAKTKYIRSYKYIENKENQNGLFYGLSVGGNAYKQGLVFAESAPFDIPENSSIANYVGLNHKSTDNATCKIAGSFFEVHIKHRLFIPKGYVLRNGTSTGEDDIFYNQGWKLEGSFNDGLSWDILDSQTNNTELCGRGTIAYFPITNGLSINTYYNQFRIITTQPRKNNQIKRRRNR